MSEHLQHQQQQRQHSLSLEDVTFGVACHDGHDTATMGEMEEEDLVREKLVSVRCDDSVTDGSTADIEDDVIDDMKSGFGRKLRKKRLKRVKKKKPLYRSDFVGNSSSSDEDEVAKNKKTVTSIRNQNPADLGWMMWLWYYVVIASVSFYHGAEFCGEKLADFFGITSPKYQYAINEYRQMKEEEREEEECEKREAECTRQRHHNKLANIEMAKQPHQKRVAQDEQESTILFQPQHGRLGDGLR